MTPRPIYRWKSFWLGVVLVLFLGWAWNNAMKVDQWARVETPGFTFGVGQYMGRAGVFANSLSQKWGISRDSTSRSGEVVAFPSPWDVRMSRIDGSHHRVWQFRARFAHWFLMLILLGVWSAWLVWRWRRGGGSLLVLSFEFSGKAGRRAESSVISDQ